MNTEKFRDPVHNFIYVSQLEKEIINSAPFQRLRYIKQLAFTYFIYHGAEHTRFGHSLGVMHLVSKAFSSAVHNAMSNKETGAKAREIFTPEKRKWYEQILRLIALTHDLGHAPFSHAAESVFEKGLAHEDYTEKIIKETEIGESIRKIGETFVQEFGPEYNITPELICDIYMGRDPGPNNIFTFLKTFMDSEMDCDKMDYLLRDSLFCGVNYGKFDLERLISCLTIYFPDDAPDTPRLAIKHGGIQSFEEFVLARYFMFVQVYFHGGRRFLDIAYGKALEKILPNGKFPTDIREYLEWNDNLMLAKIHDNAAKDRNCEIIDKRIIYKTVYETKTHPEERADFLYFNAVKNHLKETIGKDYIAVDKAAEKMPHKIPMSTSAEDEKAIVILNEREGQVTTISEESLIIKTLTQKINIQRLYASPEKEQDARAEVKKFLESTK